MKLIDKSKPFDFIMLASVLALLFMGIIMVSSASSYTALTTYNNSSHFLIKQLISAIIGIAVMIVISTVDYRYFKKKSNLIYILAIILMFCVLIPGIGMQIKGARRWLPFPIIGSFQPSELMKVAIIIKLSEVISKDPNRLKTLKGWGIIGIVLGLVVLTLFFQDHMSATVVITLISVAIFVAGGLQIRYILVSSVVGFFGAIGFILADPYRLTRIMTFFNPPADIRGSAWQTVNSLYAIGSGGLFGLGLGQSREKYLYLPEPQNDFIFSILGEELGLIGCLLVISLFCIFIWRGVVTAIKCKDLNGTLVSIGITAMFAIQIIVNIAVVTGTVPVTGMPLPFFSYGGTALIINLAAVGILLNISRQNGI